MTVTLRGQLTVKITLALLGDATAALLLVLLEDLDLLERLEDLAVDAAASINVLGGTGAAVLGAAVNLAETANTDSLPQVDMAGDGRGADVVPVNVLGGHLLGRTGLDGINPTYTAPVSDGIRSVEVSREAGGTNQAQGACPGASGKPRRPLFNVSFAMTEEMQFVNNLPTNLWAFSLAAT